MTSKPQPRKTQIRQAVARAVQKARPSISVTQDPFESIDAPGVRVAVPSDAPADPEELDGSGIVSLTVMVTLVEKTIDALDAAQQTVMQVVHESVDVEAMYEGFDYEILGEALVGEITFSVLVQQDYLIG